MWIRTIVLALLPLVSLAAIERTEEGERNYTIGQEKTSYVGEPMVSSKSFAVTRWDEEVYAPTEDFWFKLTIGPDTRFGAGTEMKRVGSESINGKVYSLVELPSPMLRNYRLMVDDTGLFIGYVKGPHKVISAGANVFIGVRPRHVQFEKRTASRARTGGMVTNHEIIYSGRTRDAINLLYREYTENDLARPAFSQNLTYDPSSTSIRFRQTVIRVIEVTGDSIRFVVEADGSAGH